MTATTMTTPTYRVTIGGQDITARIRSRLVSLTITSSRQDHADQLDLQFEDTDGRVALPRRGVEARVEIGFDGTGVGLQGTFVVDEVEHAGAPDVITVRGRSANVSGPLRTRKERSWSNTTIGQVVAMIAAEHALQPRVAPTLSAKPVTQLDQTENDMALLQRLGRQFDAVATVKNGFLLFAPVGAGQTASGRTLPLLSLTRAAGDQHRFHAADRNAYTGVRARWHDVGAARGHTFLAGKTGHVHMLRGDYANAEEAKRAAEAEFARVRRGVATFSLSLAKGRPEVYPEMPVKLSGWLPDIDGTDWIITQATHTLDANGGYTTALELETKAAAADSPAQQEADGDNDNADDEGEL